jgi:hypothetical protein
MAFGTAGQILAGDLLVYVNDPTGLSPLGGRRPALYDGLGGLPGLDSALTFGDVNVCDDPIASAGAIVQPPPATSFDRGVSRFTWLMIRFIAVMVPLVFIINGLTKHDWREAFFFAVAVAVGLTPEMLPMIVTVCLSRGAMAMSGKRVIVKRLNSIQNLGAMDVLCTDKTGTLTMDRIILERHCDVSLP